MKNYMVSVLAAGAAFVAVAAQNDPLITFSTPGPDKYADGATVMDGEYYALCWSKDFAKFAIKADGTAENGEVVLSAPFAKGGRCPTVFFEIDAEKAATDYAGGSWAVYLLDTRVFAADGKATLSGKNRRVNTVGKVGEAFAAKAGSVSAKLAEGGVATSEVATGVEVPEPKITGIKVVDGYVYVSVKQTVPFLGYGISETDLAGANVTAVGEAKVGKAGSEEEIVLVAPAKDGGAFLKVGRR